MQRNLPLASDEIYLEELIFSSKISIGYQLWKALGMIMSLVVAVIFQIMIYTADFDCKAYDDIAQGMSGIMLFIAVYALFSIVLVFGQEFNIYTNGIEHKRWGRLRQWLWEDITHLQIWDYSAYLLFRDFSLYIQVDGKLVCEITRNFNRYEEISYYISDRTGIRLEYIAHRPIERRLLGKIKQLFSRESQIDNHSDGGWDDEVGQSYPAPSYVTEIPEPTSITASPSSRKWNTINLLILTLVAGIAGARLMIAIVVWASYVPVMWGFFASVFGMIVMWLGVWFTRVHNGRVAAFAGALLGLLIWCGFYGGMYLHDQQQFADESGSPTYFMETLEAATGQTGIIGYFLYRSIEEIPVKVTRSLQIPFQGTSLLIAMLLELPVVMYVVGRSACDRTQEPFCEATNNWVKFRKVGQVPSPLSEEFCQAITDGDYSAAQETLHAQEFGLVPHLTIWVGVCHSQGYLRIQAIKMNCPLEGTHNVTKDTVQVLMQQKHVTAKSRR